MKGVRDPSKTDVTSSVVRVARSNINHWRETSPHPERATLDKNCCVTLWANSSGISPGSATPSAKIKEFDVDSPTIVREYPGDSPAS